MKTISSALLIVFAVCAGAHAQTAPTTGLTGTWQVEGGGGWSIDLKVDGTSLTGMIRQNAIPGTEIAEGAITGNTVTFTVKPMTGGTVTFTGKVNGDEISFTREGQFPATMAGGNLGLLGPGGLPNFVASRLVATSVWPGTIRNAPTPRNATPPPNPRPVTLGAKRVATPHWRWRGGDKETEVRTFALPMGSFELSSFDLAVDRLSFSFSRPGPGDVVQCNLSRQPEGKFAGACAADGGGFSVLIELTPPAGATQK